MDATLPLSDVSEQLLCIIPPWLRRLQSTRYACAITWCTSGHSRPHLPVDALPLLAQFWTAEDLSGLRLLEDFLATFFLRNMLMAPIIEEVQPPKPVEMEAVVEGELALVRSPLQLLSEPSCNDPCVQLIEAELSQESLYEEDLIGLLSMRMLGE
mmetsp:Transcript_64572/g.154279  ORF Transcript_64572/g.154279 Transcript_64572/m.154279 type:complete len:155 (-) Transcript_64572:494-958(-)